MDRFARQRLLAAVGDQGQERIRVATYVVRASSPRAADVERAYLMRAGAEGFAAAPVPASTFAHRAVFKHAAARDFAEGAWHALGQLKGALDQG